MYNKYYYYPNINMYDPEIWMGHYSPIRYLFHKIEEINHEKYKIDPSVNPYAGKETEYNGKTTSYFYPDFISKWKKKGLRFHSSEMGDIRWTAMIPEDVYTGKERAPKVLVILNDSDYKDPNWSIAELTAYENCLEMAAQQKFIALFIVPNGVNLGDTPFGVMQEFSVIYNIKMDEVLLDVSALKKNGIRLSEINGFAYRDAQGKVSEDPDAFIKDFNGIPVLDISHQWQNRYSGVMEINAAWVQHPKFDKEGFVHSAQGRVMADELRMEYDYDFGDDPAFLKLWDEQGLEIASHDYQGFQWISCAPKGYLGQQEEKLPAVLIFQEVTYQDRHQIVSACAAFKGFLELAMTGELIVLFFALESVEDNDRFYGIAQEAAKIYPIDLQRLYVTGQSHNGYYCDVFAHRFHDKIAAVAPLSNHPGIPEPQWATSPCPVSDEMLEEWSKHELPTMVITSIAESRNPIIHCRQDDDAYSSAGRAYQRRQKSQNCKVLSVEEINATPKDPNKLRAEIGYPVDDAWVEYHNDAPVYIGELINKEGKRHFRLGMLTNQTHLIAPQMPALAWSFMKRFARDLETGKTIELY